MLDLAHITLVLIPVFLYTALVGGANIPPAEPEEWDLETLTHFDLRNLPMDNNTYRLPTRRNNDLQCKSFRSKMQISDGFCTSIKPVSSILCTGRCMPSGDIPWYAMTLKLWRRSKTVEYRCEDDVVKRKKVKLVCENGQTRTISIKVVRSCVCTRYVRDQNRSLNRHSEISDSNEGKKKGKNGRRKHRNRDKNGRRKDRRKENRRRKGDKKDRKTSGRSRTPSEL